MSSSSRMLAGGAAALAAALSLATPQIMQWEGKRNTPYRDLGGVMTVCYGETRAPMRRYSDAECSAMLVRRAERDFAKPILACVPGLATRPHVFAASISLSYNIGVSAFCRSTVARRFRTGDWTGGCDALLAWNRVGGKIVRGLSRRREAERQICRHAINNQALESLE